MVPIPIFGGRSLGEMLVTLVAAVVPALLAWWHDRRLIGKADDPVLPELLAHRRRFNVRAIATAIAMMVVFGGTAAAWGIPLLLALLLAATYPLRTRLLGETWGFGAYLWHTTASIVGGFGFWIALCYAPGVVREIIEWVGAERRWGAIALAAVVAAALVAWEAWYPRVWLRTHAAERLTSPELTPRFDEIVRRAGTVVPEVYRVGPQGSRFVNAVALPSAHRPAVAMGNALLDLLDPDETAAIFAHEVAHFDHFSRRHVRRAQLLNRALIVTGVALPFIAAFSGGGSGWGRWIGWVWPIVVLLAVGRRAAKSQQHETESDLRAAALCGDPEALVRGLVKLHLHARIPRRYAADIERVATHPSLVRRIQAIRAGGAEAVEQLGAATVVRSTREGSWVVLEDTRSYWLDGVPDGTEAQLAALRDASSSYRAVNYQDLVELRVAAVADARTITARTRGGDRWNVPIAADDVARVQRALDVVDVRLGKAGPAPPHMTPKVVATVALVVSVVSGQAGVVLAPILVALSKSSASALAAVGAMCIARAGLGALQGSSWFTQDLFPVALAALAAVGVFAIYTSARLVRAGEGQAHFRLTMAVLLGVALAIGVGVVMQAATAPATPLVGAPMVAALGTALFGVAAALFTMRTRWARPAAFAGLIAAAIVATLGADLRAVRLRHALAESTVRATPGPETELAGVAGQLRVSPDGSHFLASAQGPIGVRAGVRQRPSLVTGRVGGAARTLVGVGGDFVDDARLLVVDVLDRGIELRLESVDGGAAPLWADTLASVGLTDPRLVIDRRALGWVLVGTEADSDRTTVVAGRIAEKGGARRSVVPDTIPMSGEPVVFDGGATLIVPSYRNVLRGQGMPPVSLWSLPFFGVDMPAMELWLVRGDSVRPLAPLRGAVQCGEPEAGIAACAVRRMNGTRLVTVTSAGAATEVAHLSPAALGQVSLGPGLRAVAATFDRGIVLIDLGTRRLSRFEVPPNGEYASEVRAGPGWVVTLGYGQHQRSTIRSYRLERD